MACSIGNSGGGMKEIPFTNNELWSDFYNRMTADNYDYYVVCFLTTANDGYKHMGTTIMTCEYLDKMNTDAKYEVSIILIYGANNLALRYLRRYVGDQGNLVVGYDLYKIYGVKL